MTREEIVSALRMQGLGGSETEIEEALAELVEAGLLIVDGDSYDLTEVGKDVGNFVFRPANEN